MKIWIKRFLQLTLILVSASVLFFCVFEFVPSLIGPAGLDRIEYWAQRDTYVADSELVVRPRVTNYSYTSKWPAGTDDPQWGVPLQIRSFHCNYNELGFRKNSSGPPFDAVFVGDSFLEIGEGDDWTLSEQTKRKAGLRTFNLGTGFYGPYQYLAVLKRYGLSLKPKIAFFCFFRGNDIWDIDHYEKWRGGGNYYSFHLNPDSLIQRYLIATRQSLTYAAALFDTKKQGGQNQSPYLAIARLRSGTVRMTLDIGYGDTPAAVEQLLSDQKWMTLRTLLHEFRETCRTHGIRPVAVFIPSKNQIYYPYITDSSGSEMLREKQLQEESRLNSRDAFSRIVAVEKIELIDLCPRFTEEANRGQMLYYPFDSHWNPAGIEVAAEEITAHLRN